MSNIFRLVVWKNNGSTSTFLEKKLGNEEICKITYNPHMKLSIVAIIAASISGANAFHISPRPAFSRNLKLDAVSKMESIERGRNTSAIVMSYCVEIVEFVV